jgi:hypothetical protein
MDHTADIFTVLSDGKLKVRPIAAGQDDRLVPLEWQASRQWYEMKNARFLIFKDYAFNVNAITAIRTWGYPAERTEIDGYTIMRWETPLHLAEGAVIPK